MRRFLGTIGVFGLALGASPALAQQSQMGGMGHDMQSMHNMPGMKNMGPAHHEMMTAMDRMNKAMMQGMMDPDPGKAWMKSMMAHHRGAIEMSQIVMRYSKDPNVLQEARKTATENQRSLAELQAKMR